MQPFSDADSRPLVFSDADLERLFDRHHVNAAGRALVRKVRSSPPSRVVRPGPGHVTGAYPSPRMGFALQYESLIELSFIMECEFDRSELECFDQPDALTLRYLGKNEHPVTVASTQDFLLVSNAFLGYVECKPDDVLARLAREFPGRWSCDPDGTWRSIPAEQAAARYGLGFRVRSSSSFLRTLLDNLAFLHDYRVLSCPPVGEDAAQRIRDHVSRRLGLTLEELIHETGDPEAIYRLIALGVLHVDLDRHFLSQPHLVQVFHDAQSSRIWDAARVSEVGVGAEFDPRAPISDSAALALQAASEPDRDVALRRYEAIRPVIEGTAPFSELSAPKGPRPRTLQDWLARWRRAECDDDCGFLGLLPRVRFRGNRVPRLEPELYTLMDEVVDEVYEQLPCPPMTDAYASLVGRCKSRGLFSPSYRRFVEHIKARPQRRQKASREGHRAAVANEPATFATGDGFAPHGQRPFDIVHIDHTQVDLFLRLGGFTFNLSERAWLTIADCDWSLMPLGYALSFDPPSYVSCMMVMRGVVRRHQRLSRVLFVDGAKEFRSIAFDQLCAAYRVDKRHRPPGEPRYGARCDRFFGTVNTQFIHTLWGNTKHLRDPRGMSPEVDPRRHVVWTLPEFDRCLEEYLFHVYPSQPQPDIAGTPRDRFTQGLELTGYRRHRQVPYDQKFFLLSLPPSRRGVATVDRRKGFQVEGGRYHSEALSSLHRKKVHVRIDPEDAGHVFVHAPPSPTWIQCFSKHYQTLHGCSRRQLRLATLALAGGRKRGAKSPRITAEALADFLASAKQYEALERQRLRDAARRPSVAPTAQSAQPATDSFSACDAEGSLLVESAPATDEALVAWSDLPAPVEAA